MKLINIRYADGQENRLPSCEKYVFSLTPTPVLTLKECNAEFIHGKLSSLVDGVPCPDVQRAETSVQASEFAIILFSQAPL